MPERGQLIFKTVLSSFSTFMGFGVVPKLLVAVLAPNVLELPKVLPLPNILTQLQKIRTLQSLENHSALKSWKVTEVVKFSQKSQI